MHPALYLVGLAVLCYVIWQYGVPSALGRGIAKKQKQQRA